VAGRISPRPLLIVHGAENELHKPVEAQSMYEEAASGCAAGRHRRLRTHVPGPSPARASVWGPISTM
jgi:fermentation-respiration switch protein FrsA (DUF1100 family)